MASIEIKLTEDQFNALKELSAQTEKPVAELIHESLSKLIEGTRRVGDRASLQIARGIWKNRDDPHTLS
ncbi:MAG: hypothetical protein QOF62_396 [Pyrinomonadaceae bacterium]|jgi:hypothetical protein|nr:hypothetical protein [Pyrinomonadaceae bacterium]